MIAKDILRIVLFLLVAIFALRYRPRTRFRDSVRINSNAETEDTETKQMLQRMQDTREKITREPNQYENTTAGKEN